MILTFLLIIELDWSTD